MGLEIMLRVYFLQQWFALSDPASEDALHESAPMRKVRYRGLKKNHKWLCAGFALVNLYQNRRRLAKINQRPAPQGA